MTNDDTDVAVLIVDDNADKRLALRAALAPLDFSIVEAGSGTEALRRVMEQDFAVILLDVHMDELDGFETAALIRERRQSEMTPIIFVTAHSSEEMNHSNRYANGAVDFIFAPVIPEELRAKVSAFANLFVRAATLAARARMVQTSADQLMLMTDAAPIGIFQTDQNDRFIYTNPHWSELTGLSAIDAVGKVWDSLLIANGWHEIVEENSHQGVVTAESRRFAIRNASGDPLVALMTKEPIPGDEGGVSGWVGTLADVTAETRADEERARFRSLVQNSRDVIAVIDASGICSYVSEGVVNLGGYTPEEAIGKSAFEFIHPHDEKIIASHLAEVVAAPDSTKTVEVRTRGPSGEWIWIEVRAVDCLADPSVNGIVLNYHDITERREAVDRLAQSERTLAGGQSLAHLGSWSVDLRTKAVTWSDEEHRLLGFEPGTVEPSLKLLLDRVHPDDREMFSSQAEEAVAGGSSFELDFRINAPGRPIRWIHGVSELILEDGVPVTLVGMNHDITASKEAEDERLTLLAQQKHLATQLRMLLDSTAEGIFGLDITGACTFMNKAGAELLGGDAGDFVGKNMHDLTHHTHSDGSPYPAEECPVYEGLRTGTPMSARGDVVWRLDRTSIPVDFSSHPIGGVGETEGAVVTFQDITLRQGMEAQLRQAQKMEAVGQLAGGVAHDFNNILAVVLNYAEFVSETLDEGHEGHADLEQIVKAGERGAELVHQLLAFSRQEIIQPRVLDLNEVISGMAIMLDRSVGEEVALVIESDEDLNATKIDQGQMEQILLNLVVNARDAMAQGGRITISTSNEELREEQYEGLSGGDYVRLTVGDTGAGIDPSTLEHIFEPFFTTKPRGEGTGLGLATVYGIVKRAVGGIYAESSEAGTTFSVFLPVTKEEQELDHVPRSSALPTDETATILVVEDEDAVRELIGRILRRAGFEVLEAARGAMAVELCTEHPDPIHLLLTDVVMPEMSGPALRDLVQPLRPDMAILFMSGYTDELIAKRGVLGSGELLLNKPFNSEELLARVRDTLHPTDAGHKVLEVSR